MAENFGVGGPGRPGGRPGLSRRQLVGVSGALGLTALGAAGCQSDEQSRQKDLRGLNSERKADTVPGGEAARVDAPPPEGVLGANFNGDPSELKWAELEDISATWLRGFFPMHQADKARKPQIETLLTASERGYGTALSLKFQYSKEPLPAPGSPAMKKELKRLDKVLALVMKKVDILVIGNEPFLETREADRRPDRINVFYEAVAKHVISYRDKHSATGTRLYMGALNHLDQQKGRTPATRRWMEFVKNTGAIDGVDIHPHLSAPGGGQKYLHYILPKMRDDQKFLATEFSLVLFFKDQLAKKVSVEFEEAYEEEKGKLVWQVIEKAIDKRFTQKKWDDFLSMSPWFDSNRTYMQDQVDAFRRTGRLALATYGVVQDADMIEGFDEDKKNPWLLNSLFCPYTVQPGKDGLPGRNRAWITAFRELQRN